MPVVLLQFLQRWLVTTMAVLVADFFVRGIDHRGVGPLLAASALLGLLNAFVRPALLLLSLPLVVWSLGLFVLVINAVLLLLVGALLEPGFSVHGFGSAFWGALIISVVSLLVNLFLGRGPTVKVSKRNRGGGSRRRGRDDDGGGPIIDV